MVLAENGVVVNEGSQADHFLEPGEVDEGAQDVALHSSSESERNGIRVLLQEVDDLLLVWQDAVLVLVSAEHGDHVHDHDLLL